MSFGSTGREHSKMVEGLIDNARGLRLGAVREIRKGDCQHAIVWVANSIARAEKAICHAGSAGNKVLLQKAHEEWMRADTLLRKVVAHRCSTRTK